MMELIKGDVCSPQGFVAAGIYAGIRKNPQKPDLAIIYSQQPAVAAGVFTLNKVKAAPVQLTKQHLKNKTLQAIVVNSGNANACTGKLGMQHAKKMATVTAAHLKLTANQVAVASTGVIGVTLPIEKITAGIKIAAEKLSTEGESAAQAIMTTDTFQKTIAIKLNIGGKTVCIGGMSKGSGMIHPNMATMLGFITTDADISQTALQTALSKITQTSFNMITVDGDCSTNDMVVILANGLAKNPPINSSEDPNWQIFYNGLSQVCTFLAKEIARDGEGATKLLEVKLKGAMNEKQARLAARAVCQSSLVKAAMFGNDANWGRIASALGASGAKVNANQLTIGLGDHILFKQGTPLPFDEAQLLELLKQKTISIQVDLGIGTGSATAWGCDLTYDYVKINGSYRS